MLRVAATTLLCGASSVEAASAWVYANAGATAADGDAQTATWGTACTSGKEQSPIDVVTAKAMSVTSTPPLETHFDTSVSYVKNTGHGFQIFETHPNAHTYNASETDKSSVDKIGGGSKGYSMIGGAKYNFYQVHWHTPSENTIDGQEFAMEAHFVHQLDDDALHGTYHRLAVIGLMYEMGTDAECNTLLDQFWGSFPEAKGVASYTGNNVDLNAKLNAELAKGYYHWYGSLTTPPCTEGVSWNLLKVKEKVCKRQVDALKAALSATQNGIGFNNRVPQPLNHRRVVEVVPGSGTSAPANYAALPEVAGGWVYANAGKTAADANDQNATWGGLCMAGREQSPINVVTSAVADATSQVSIQTEFQTTASYVKNSGHGYQVFETSPNAHKYNQSSGTEVSVDAVGGGSKGHSMIGGAKYNFYQVHWHAPSENTIDGKEFAMEAHFVHQLDDDALHGTYHRLAVIGLMYELGTEADCNPTLDLFWDSFPAAKGVGAYTGANFNLNDKLNAELAQGYYHWYGSLTTPPCTEGVSWNLLKKTEKVCPKQVDALKAALSASQSGIGFNNRVPQPLNHRVVVEMKGTSTTSGSLADKTEASNGVRVQQSLALLLLAAMALTR